MACGGYKSNLAQLAPVSLSPTPPHLKWIRYWVAGIFHYSARGKDFLRLGSWVKTSKLPSFLVFFVVAFLFFPYFLLFAFFSAAPLQVFILFWILVFAFIFPLSCAPVCWLVCFSVALFGECWISRMFFCLFFSLTKWQLWALVTFWFYRLLPHWYANWR